ncbi:MAG: 5-methyltetrahydropteroyltriglutamate--homocysteine S-methyltransferase [Betaproteobacteria bacterium]|nr:5-methyltetrahydropteroyltriglutamate--homocysteine S-methyltransferase [Betaproteobacteria bacterium]
MNARTSPPFRAEHVGSLLRPAPLLRAREKFAAGSISAAALRRIEDDAIRDAVRMQQDIGLQVITDGEFRRDSWHVDFILRIGGMRAGQEASVVFRNRERELPWISKTFEVVAPLAFERCIFGDDYGYLKSLASRGTPKLTLPSPNMTLPRGNRDYIDRRIYPDLDGYMRDLAAVYRAQLAALGELGCSYLQLDDTTFGFLADPRRRRDAAAVWGNEERMLDACIRLFNDAVSARPAGMRLCVHICRGNFRSSWVGEGGYDFLAQRLFRELDVDGFFLEFDDERSGSFEPLREVPAGKCVVLGLLTSKRAELETKDAIRRRIDEAAKCVPLEQLCLSPQCGFSSTFDGNALSRGEQIAKLERVVEVARDVWG